MEKITLDLELKKAFFNLQVKMIETNKKIQDINEEIATLTRVHNQMKLNTLGIAVIPKGAKTYEAVGRTFIRKDFAKLKEDLAEREDELVTLIKEKNDSIKCLKKNLGESEDYVREIVKQRKDEIKELKNMPEN